MLLELENGLKNEIRDPETLRAALETLNEKDNTFAILSVADERYIQAAQQADGFIIEKRDGSFDRHFSAVQGDRSIFTLDEVAEVFVGYFAAKSSPPGLRWTPTKMPSPGSLLARTQNAKAYLLIGVPLLVSAAIIIWGWFSR